jgi:hypothetical protein
VSEIKGREYVMKAFKIFFVVTMALLLYSSIAVAGDFDWVKDFNLTAQADPSGFRARLSTRFQIGDAKINAVIGNVENPADAYMVLRLGELSNQPPERVMKEYKSGKGKGWGVLAKRLGIKPGSKEFHALKRGHDLDDRDIGGDKGNGGKDKGGKDRGGKGKGGKHK